MEVEVLVWGPRSRPRGVALEGCSLQLLSGQALGLGQVRRPLGSPGNPWGPGSVWGRGLGLEAEPLGALPCLGQELWQVAGVPMRLAEESQGS